MAEAIVVLCPNGCGNLHHTPNRYAKDSKCPNCGAQTMLVTKGGAAEIPDNNAPDTCSIERTERNEIGTPDGRPFEYGGVVKLDEKRVSGTKTNRAKSAMTTRGNVLGIVGFVGTVLFFIFGTLICFEEIKSICHFLDDEQSDIMEAKTFTVLAVFVGAIALRFIPAPKRLKTNLIAAEIYGGIEIFYILAAGILTLGGVVISVVGILFFLYGFVSGFGSHSKPVEIAPSYVSDANRGYMTRQDDALLTATAVKKGYGESLTKDEQEFLDRAETGKLGKPYGERPDKEHDSPDASK